MGGVDMTDRAVDGFILAIGAVLFLVGAGNPILARAWVSPRESYLRIVAGHPKAWRATNVLFVAGTVLTAAGIAALPPVAAITTGGPRLFAAIACFVILIGAILWVVSLVGRLVVTPDLAVAFVAGLGDPTPVPSERWMGSLFGSFILLAGSGLIGLGAAFIAAAVLSIAGWACAAFGVILTGGYLLFGDVPPFVVYLPTGLIGLSLILGWG
jgi:hypothetical protein